MKGINEKGKKSMKITEINITPIKPSNGLVAFASCVVNNSIYIGSIGLITKLDGGFRLTYPTKKSGAKQINLFHPINLIAGKQIESAIISKYEEVMKKSNDRHHQIGNTTEHVYHN